MAGAESNEAAGAEMPLIQPGGYQYSFTDVAAINLNASLLNTTSSLSYLFSCIQCNGGYRINV